MKWEPPPLVKCSCETPPRVRFLPLTNQHSTQCPVWRLSRSIEQKGGCSRGAKDFERQGFMGNGKRAKGLGHHKAMLPLAVAPNGKEHTRCDNSDSRCAQLRQTSIRCMKGTLPETSRSSANVDDTTAAIDHSFEDHSGDSGVVFSGA